MVSNRRMHQDPSGTEWPRVAMAKYILVGADPVKSKSAHSGGVLTLSIGLIDYARRHGHAIEVINTLRPGFGDISFGRRLRAGWDRVLELYRALRAGDCDGVVIFSGAGFSFYERITLSAICRWFGVRDLFVIVDGWFLEIGKATFFKRYWTGLLLRIPHKLAASGARWSTLFRELGIEANRVASIHYWLRDAFVISENRKTVTPGKPLQFIFVGWMIKEKGIHELLAAIEELMKNYQFSLTFVGAGTLLEYVRQKIRDLKWTKNISASGWVSNEDLEQMLSSADVFVLPSYAEGFPLSLIEAFSRGLPAICTDVGGISDSLLNGVNGYLIPPRQVQPLVKAMERYLKNPQIISDHSQAALEIVRANHRAEANCELVFDALR